MTDTKDSDIQRVSWPCEHCGSEGPLHEGLECDDDADARNAVPSPRVDGAKVETLRSLAEEATPGPWFVEGYEGTQRIWCEESDGERFEVAQSYSSVGDGDFIAAANPKVILELCDTLAEQSRKLVEAKRERDQANYDQREASDLLVSMTRVARDKREIAKKYEDRYFVELAKVAALEATVTELRIGHEITLETWKKQTTAQHAQLDAREATVAELRSEVTIHCNARDILISRLATRDAELARLREEILDWHNSEKALAPIQYTACLTGDCPHFRQDECNEWIAGEVRRALNAALKEP